jgi:hypothetical protein
LRLSSSWRLLGLLGPSGFLVGTDSRPNQGAAARLHEFNSAWGIPNCREQQLKLTPMAHGSPTEPEFVSTYGVEGCEHRAVYVHVPNTQDWVNNTASDGSGKGGVKPEQK